MNPIIAGLRRRVAELEAAIRTHRDQRGDDRCWMDDETLYRVLPEGYSPPERDSAVELERCKQYIECRHNPGTEYVSPQRRIEELETEVCSAAGSISRMAGRTAELEAEVERLRAELTKIAGIDDPYGCPCDNDGRGCPCEDIAREALAARAAGGEHGEAEV